MGGLPSRLFQSTGKLWTTDDSIHRRAGPFLWRRGQAPHSVTRAVSWIGPWLRYRPPSAAHLRAPGPSLAAPWGSRNGRALRLRGSSGLGSPLYIGGHRFAVVPCCGLLSMSFSHLDRFGLTTLPGVLGVAPNAARRFASRGFPRCRWVAIAIPESGSGLGAADDENLSTGCPAATPP